MPGPIQRFTGTRELDTVATTDIDVIASAVEQREGDIVMRIDIAEESEKICLQLRQALSGRGAGEHIQQALDAVLLAVSRLDESVGKNRQLQIFSVVKKLRR